MEITLPTWLTPSFVTTGLTILSIVVILVGFWIGYIRGTFKATYRLIVSVVVVLGLWLLLPLITNSLLDVNLQRFGINPITFIGYSEVQGMECKSINDFAEIVSRLLLGLTTENGTTLILNSSSVVIQETMIYTTIISLVEMVLRIALILVILILNWTLFRFIFFIVYQFIKPKRENKYQKKKTTKSRLIGGAIGTFNMIIILIIICIPLSGVFSLAESGVELIADEESAVIKTSLGTEVIDPSGNNNFIEIVRENEDWVKVYRNTFLGKVFGIKIKSTELDCALFDSLFTFKVGEEKIALRREVKVCLDSLKPLRNEVIIPLLNNENVTNIIDNLSSENVKEALHSLSQLKIVNACVNLSYDTLLIGVKNGNMLSEEYVSIKDIILNLEGKNIDAAALISQLGDLSASLLQLVDESGIKLSELLNENTDQTVNKLVEALLKVDTDTVTNIFDNIAKIELINLLQEVAFPTLKDYIENNEKVDQVILLYPKVEYEETNEKVLFKIDGVYTKVEYDGSDLNKVNFKVDENNKWIINGKTTDIDASNNIFKLNFEGIKITDEIRNIGALYKAFKDLDVTSISEIQNLITNGITSESYDLEKLTYEKIDNLFKALLDFKVVTNSIDNIYVLVNNMLPNEYRGMITMSNITSEDLTSLVYAGKVLAQTGIVWNQDMIKTDDDIDYTKVYDLFEKVKDDLSNNITKSSIVVDNVNTFANYAISMVMPDTKLDFNCINWKENGNEELTKLFNVVSVFLKYGNKITKDFYSLEDSEIDEIAEVVKENAGDSVLLKTNMNTLITKVNEIEQVNKLGLVIAPIDDDEWTKEEFASIFESAKIGIKMLKDTGGTTSDLLLQLLKLNQDDIDTVLDSKFLSLNIVYNLCEQTKEGQMLHDKVIVNLKENDSRWFDNGTQKGELRVILSNAIKLINGVESFENTDALVEQVVKNISNLSDNFGKENDEIGEILSSMVISDTLMYYFKNLDKFLSEEITSMIVIPEDIKWKDSTTEGELRKILTALKDLLIDKDGNVIINELKTGDQNKIIGMLVKLDEEKINQVLDSRIILNTAIKFIEDYSKKEDSSLKIFLQMKTRTEEDWKNQMSSVLTGLKEIIVDKDGNVIGFDLQTEEYIEILSNLKEENIDKLLDSEILVDTIAHLIINMADEDNSFFYVSKSLRVADDLWNEPYTNEWRTEIKNILTSSKVVLFDEDGNSQYKKLTEGTTEELVEIITDLSDEDVDKLVNSNILVDTIAHLIIKIADEENSIFYVADDLRADKYSWNESIRSLWKQEIKDIASASKEILLDKEGNSQYRKLTEGTTEMQVNILLEIEDTNKLVQSRIIVDTISKLLKDMSSNNEFIYISDEVNNYTTEEWKDEIVKIVNSCKALLLHTDSEGNKVTNTKAFINGNTEEILDALLDISEENIVKITDSRVIVDTISKTIKDLSSQENAVIIVSNEVENYSFEEWKEEITKLIKSLKSLLINNDNEKQTAKLLSGDENDVLNLIIEIGDNKAKINKILDSQIIYETIVNKIKDLANNGDSVLSLPKDIDSWDKEAWSDEVTNIIVASELLLVEEVEGVKKVNLDKLNGDINSLVQIIVDLYDETKEKDDLDKVLDSKIILETISSQILKIGNENDTIVVSGVQDYTSDKWRLEIRSIVVSCKLILTDETGKVDIEGSTSNVNNILNNISNIKNKPNESDDEVGKVLQSKIIQDTIIEKIKEQSTTNGGILVISDDIKWLDTIENGLITKQGELRLIFKALPILFKDSVDINKLDANIVMDLSDTEIDTVLESKVLSDTINLKLEELEDLNEDIYVGDITDLNKEVKAIIKASKIILGDESGKVDLTNPTFDVEKILHLTDEEQNTILESQIILNSIKNKLINMKNDTILVVDEEEITDWKAELKSVLVILNQDRKILKKDANGKYLTNPEVDYNVVYNLDETQINEIVASRIIVDTITICLCDIDTINTTNIINSIKRDVPNFDTLTKEEQNKHITRNSLWHDTTTSLGEIHKLLLASSKITTGEEVDINKLKTISDANLDVVFQSQIILDTFYQKIDELSEGLDPVLFIKEGTEKNKAEAIKFVNSIKVVLGDSDITTIDSSEFSFDKFIGLSDSDITKLLASEIIRYSASKKTHSVITTGSLNDYISLSGTEENDIDTISDDLENLLKMIRDLNNEGINYNNFSFETFKNSITSDEKADDICDILLTSNLIKNSIEKIVTTLIINNENLDVEMKNAIDINMDHSQTGGRNEWLDNGSNPGEFKKVFRLLSSIDKFTNGTDNNSFKDASTISKPLHQINDSKVLCGLIPLFVNKTTANVETWKYGDGDPLYINPKDRNAFTKELWDTEIDILCNIIALVNKEETLSNLDSMNIKDSQFTTDSLEELLREIAKSRILNIAKVEEFIKKAIDETFFGVGSDTVVVESVYTGNVYDEKVNAWIGVDKESGEVSALIKAINELRNVDDIVINSSADGVKNARNIGRFLDSCKDSKLLLSCIVTIFNAKYSAALYGMTLTTDYVKTMDRTFESILTTAAQYGLLD